MKKTLLLTTILILALGLIMVSADQNNVINKDSSKITKVSQQKAERQPELTAKAKAQQEIDAKLAVERAEEQKKIEAQQAEIILEKKQVISPEELQRQEQEQLAEQDRIRHEEYERNKLEAQKQVAVDNEVAYEAEKIRLDEANREKMAFDAETMKNLGDLPVILDTEDYCPSSYSDCTSPDDTLTNVTFNGINNNSGPGPCPDKYEDYTAISTDPCVPGNTYSISVSFLSGPYTQHVRVWIDWDQDEVFATTESYYLGSGVGATLTTDITIPLDAALGTTRMRVIEQYSSDPLATGACDGQSNHTTMWGETEDYTVQVGDYVPAYGACCDDVTGTCTDDVERLACPAPLRWAENTLCVDLDPLCGEVEGACCFPDGSCQVLSPAACATAQGDYQGDWSTCDPNPCPQPVWDCTDWPPPGKLPGGDPDTPTEPANEVCETTPAIVQCEYAYCGAVNVVGDLDWYQLVVPDWGNGDWTTFHFRVFADDTPGQYAFGGGLDPEISVYTDCALDSVLFNDDYNGTYPDAEHFDSQIDFDAPGNIFPPGSTIYIQISSYYVTGAPGPYLFVINCEPRPVPTGACCVDEVCVATNTLDECNLLQGQWYQGETCPEFVCPPANPWNCTDYPPIDKLPGGNIDTPSEPLNNDFTGAAIAQVEYAYCGDLRVDPADIADWYMVTLPNDGAWHCLHVRVFADDTPYQYAQGQGLDPTTRLYASNGTTLLYTSYGYYGAFPDAEGGDCQIDCENYVDNCFPPGTVLYLKIDCTSTYQGPYLLIINEYECDAPSGACCVDEVCVATNTLEECDLLQGQWYQDETCPEYTCPPANPWDCNLYPPPGKTGGGNIDVEPNNDYTTAVTAQVEYAYCGDLTPTDEDWYAVTLPAGPDEYYCLHVRVYADDTHWQYAYGLGLDPSLYIYASDGTTQLHYSGDHYGTWPDAETFDSQVDCADAGNCYAAGTSFFLRVDGYSDIQEGPYLLVINAIACTPPQGRCCDYTDPANPDCNDPVFEPDCQGPYMTWVEGWNCTDNPCEALPTGRCCDYTDIQDPVCTDDVYEQNCQGPALEWDEGLNCDDNPCEAVIQGDRCVWPFYVDVIPYTDSDNTCNYNDDCDISGTDNFDVIYEMEITETQYLMVSLCGSLYDTKLAIYLDDCCTGPENYWAYNDDNYDVCGSLASHIEAEFAPGTYYIVVDGFSTNCGAYDLYIGPPPSGRCCYYDEDPPDIANPLCAAPVVEQECIDLIGTYSGFWTEGILDCDADPCPVPGDFTGVETFDMMLTTFTHYANDTTSTEWEWTDVQGNPPGSAVHFYNYTANEDDYLISNGSYTVPDVDNIHLLWDQRGDWSSYYYLHRVGVSIDFAGDPATATWDWLYTGPAPEDAWENTFVSLEAYRGQAVNIAFNYQGLDADDWWVDNIIVESYIPPTGRCCYGDMGDPDCINDLTAAECFGDPYFGHDWMEAGTCEDNVCIPAGDTQCPENALFSQDPTPSTGGWTFANSEMILDSGPGYLIYENFTGLTEDICDIHFWGGALYLSGSWMNCAENPMTFEIKFYADNGNFPDTANPVCVNILTITGMPLIDLYSGSYVAYEFSADLDECCTLTDGWVSIGGVYDPTCWFMWLSHGETGSGFGYQQYMDGSQFPATDYDLSLCLTPFSEPTGACCVGTECVATNTESECAALSGTWYADETCPEFECPGGGCFEYLPGDANMYNGAWPPQVIGGDVTYLVNYFRGLSASQPCKMYNPTGTPECFWAAADANGDCLVIGSDVTKMVNFFRGTTTLDYCDDFEPCWLGPGDLPGEAPVGWPNCVNPCPPVVTSDDGSTEAPVELGQ